MRKQKDNSFILYFRSTINTCISNYLVFIKKISECVVTILHVCVAKLHACIHNVL